MSHVIRSTVQLAATAATAAAVGRVADTAFGPTPRLAVAERADRPSLVPAPERAPEPGPLLVAGTGAVRGSVTNVFGRGLRGMQVEVVDDDKTVIASATTGASGVFGIEDVPPGTYKLRALDDADGDFEKAWYGGRKFRTAASFTVMPREPMDDVVVALRSTARIDVDVSASKRRTDVVVDVTHRATGAPASGVVEFSNQDVQVTVPLVEGRAPLSLADRGQGSKKKLQIDYVGDRQTRSASTKVRLRP